MKQIRILLVMAALALLSTSCDDKPIPVEQLPEAARSYIQENYPASRILLAKKDCDLFSTHYEVKLDNGLEFSFNKNGLVIDVDD